MAKDKTDKLKGISVLFQLAGVSVMIMNAKLLGETLYYYLWHPMEPYGFLLFLAVVLSILETINNWASIKQYMKYYNCVGLFAADIVTLGVLFEQAYVLTKMVEKGDSICVVTRVKFLLITYIVLYLFYALWNYMIGKNSAVSSKERKEIIRVTGWRVVQVVSGTLAAGLLTILGESACIKSGDALEQVWIWTTSVYVGGALIILFFSQKLVDVLRIAMEAVHTS